MGFFTNIGALKEGEITLSDDCRHLYRIAKDKIIEIKKTITNSITNQKCSISIPDISKRVIYVYNIDADIWDIQNMNPMDIDFYKMYSTNIYGTYGTYSINYISDLNTYNALQKLYEEVDKLPKNMHI